MGPVHSEMTPEVRLALLESAVDKVAADVCTVDSKVDTLSGKVDDIVGKLDAALETKADRVDLAKMEMAIKGKADEEDFKEMRQLLIKILVGIAAFAVVTLIGIVMYRIGLNT